MTDFTGTAGNDSFRGKGKADVFDLSQGGDDKAAGGGGDDLFVFGQAFTAADQVNGGAGSDTLSLDGDYGAGLVFGSATITGVEAIALGAHHSYWLVLDDGNIAAGQSLVIDASELGASDRLKVDGSHETDGWLDISARFARSVLIGGAGNDRFTLGEQLSGSGQPHGGGGDVLTGGAGADSFVFLSLGRLGVRPHEITDLSADDRIDISHIDADVNSFGDQAFTLVVSFTGHAGEAMLSYDPETRFTSLQLDTNGDGKADSVVRIDGDHHDFSNFVL